MYPITVIKDGFVVTSLVFDNNEEKDFDFEGVFGEGAYAISVPDGVAFGTGWAYKDGVFTPPPPTPPTHEELVMQAEWERQTVLANANTTFYQWQTTLLMKRANDDEKIMLQDWLDYLTALNRLDIGKAPDIEWPVEPPVPEAGQ